MPAGTKSNGVRRCSTCASPDGRIFDVDTVAPGRPLAVDRAPQAAEPSGRLTQERITDDLVTAARAAFAGGRRAEAIEMLRRYEPAKEAVAQALRELTLEQQRLAADEQRQRQTAIQEHLTAATDLLNAGNLTAAWGRACDAIQLDPSHPPSIALEKRIRQLLDEQVARDQARELELALQRIEGYINRDELPEAEAALQASRDAFGTNTGLSELRERLLAAKRRTETEQAVQAALARARQLFDADDHASAIALLEKFQPSHASVDAVLEALRREAETSSRPSDVERPIDGALARPELEPSSDRNSGLGGALRRWWSRAVERVTKIENEHKTAVESRQPGPSDVVHCSVFSPLETVGGQPFLVQVIAHVPEQAQWPRWWRRNPTLTRNFVSQKS